MTQNNEDYALYEELGGPEGIDEAANRFVNIHGDPPPLKTIAEIYNEELNTPWDWIK